MATPTDADRDVDRPLDPARWRRTLFEALTENALRDGRAIAVEDQERQPISRHRLVLASLILGRKLAALGRRGEKMAVLLPNVNGVAVTLFALFAYGRVPAMLNFTAGIADLEAATASVEAKTLITSRRFVESAKLEDKVAALGRTLSVVYLEDVRAGIGFFDRIRGVLAARNPDRVHRRHRPDPDDVAIVLFTSGTERQPKAVALTHANIIANVEQCLRVLGCSEADILLNPLPVFHAFGLTGGLLLPVVRGFRALLYPSPLHYEEIPKLAREAEATIIIGIDTFAAGWAKAAKDGDFASIRMVVLGAERVRDATRQAWRERFGIEIQEGYGVTEASPVLAVNRETDNRPGKVGQLLPGVEMRLVPVEGIAAGERMHVRGPNVMAGYYFPDAPNRLEPPPDGWHDTGDIVTLDADGFITIVSRAKRFAKIAGEMISLTAVEAMVNEAWPDHASAVVAIPDPRRGEAIVIITTAAAMTRQSLLPTARRIGLADLAIPDRIISIEALPLLGSGKTDYPALERIAAAHTAQPR
ncbi:MAG: AMP-binding protein [Bauldia sp.]|nr:AMP-binding protein [Bauldia sp.]